MLHAACIHYAHTGAWPVAAIQVPEQLAKTLLTSFCAARPYILPHCILCQVGQGYQHVQQGNAV